MSVDLRIFADPETLSRAAATAIAAYIQATIEKQDRFSLAVAGGNTPRRLYGVLAAEFRRSIPWERVHIFWGDERYVPHDNPLSNYRLVRETLLDRVGIPPENVNPMPTAFPQPDDAARAYETVLRGARTRRRPWPTLSLELEIGTTIQPQGFSTLLLAPSSPGSMKPRQRY